MKIFKLLMAFYFLSLLSLNAQSDSVVLSFPEYISNITQYHPVAKKANLKLDFASAEWLSAKGNLDPVLTAGWNQKNFDDKLYYRQFQSKVKVPTSLGIDFVGGYENTEGTFLNPENKTDKYGLWNAGVEVNLLQGLLVNERRTALKQAQIFQSMAKNQQQMLLSELLYTASFAYLEWQKYHFYESVINENISIANTYFENTKTSYFNGEKTAIDTLEALIILQDAKGLLLANESALIKSRQRLENFLWFKDQPLELQETTVPQDFNEPIFTINSALLTSNLVNKNPSLMEKVNKQSYLEIEQKLKREKLKPKLKGKYNPLLATSENSLRPQLSLSDYKWGFDFSIPLFLRSERANIQKGKIKLEENQLDINDKQNELTNKVENTLLQQSILQNQLIVQEQNLERYNRLLDGENEKFRFGESSIFLLNKRQEKYINGQLKVISLRQKLQGVLLDYVYYTNAWLSFEE